MKVYIQIGLLLLVLLFCGAEVCLAQDITNMDDSIDLSTSSIDTAYSISPAPSAAPKFVPDPVKATMMGAAFPGLGQIYNRKYWKVPIVYAGLGGIVYFAYYNANSYAKFIKGYQDLADDIPETNSYTDYIKADPASYDRMNYPDSYDSSLEAHYLEATLKKADSFRKWRDYSYLGVALWYLLSIVEAHVDACLFDYDVSDNLGVSVIPIASMNPISGRAQFDIGVKVRF